MKLPTDGRDAKVSMDSIEEFDKVEQTESGRLMLFGPGVWSHDGHGLPVSQESKGVPRICAGGVLKSIRARGGARYPSSLAKSRNEGASNSVDWGTSIEGSGTSEPWNWNMSMSMRAQTLVPARARTLGRRPLEIE